MSSSYDNSPIDVLAEHAMNATNSHTLEGACCLLEVAAAAGALSLLVCYNQYRPGKEQQRSAYFAYPLVDSQVLLQGIPRSMEDELQEEDGKFICKAGFKLPDEEESGEDFEPLMCISTEAKSSTGKQPLKSPDFMLADSQTSLQKAYSISLVHPKMRNEFVAWEGLVNMSKPQVQMQGTLPTHHFARMYFPPKNKTGAGMNILAGAAAAVSSGSSSASSNNKGLLKRGRWMQMNRSVSTFAPPSSTVQEEKASSSSSASSASSSAGSGEDDDDEEQDEQLRKKKAKQQQLAKSAAKTAGKKK